MSSILSNSVRRLPRCYPYRSSILTNNNKEVRRISINGTRIGIPSSSSVSASSSILSLFSSSYSIRNHSSSTGINNFGSTLPEIIHHQGWEGAWKQNIIPWDAGVSAPILQPLLVSVTPTSTTTTATVTASSVTSSLPNLEPLPFGKVLVPGAGSSYDALEFAKAGYPTTAIDIAPTAIERARMILRDYAEKQQQQNNNNTPSTITELLRIQQADFFKLEPGAAYSVIFDYTFLCALPKSLWSDWARTVTRLIHPEGELVCILFPIGDFTGGPPYAMTPTTIRDLLVPLGWEETLLLPIPSEYSHKSRQNREYLGRYRLRSNRYPIINIGQPKVPYRKSSK